MIPFLLGRHTDICAETLDINCKYYMENYVCHEEFIVVNTFLLTSYNREYQKGAAGKEELASLQLKYP